MIINTYIQLIGKHESKNAFVIGAGSSLWHNMQNPFFQEISKYGITIVVNSAVLAIPNFNYWISNDSLCLRWSWWKNVKKGKGIKIVRNSWKKYKKELDGFLFFSPRSTPEDIINPDDIGLCYCASVPTSIDLAIQMGCKKIFVLGLDHNTIKGKHHFWQFLSKQPRQIRPAQGGWKQQRSVFPIHLKSYKALEKFAEYKNCKIYNCNPDSKVEVFKKIKFKDILKIIKE